MSTHKYIDRICAAVLACVIVLTLAFVNGEALGIQPASHTLGYENRLFDTERVHTIDIVMDGWESFLASCENEEYAACTAVIDGEAYQNIGIRAKGNTSLTTVSSMGSSRYSFKIEFDQYDSAKSYYGLDKLSLNNLIQDTTYLKDYLTYRMMAAFQVNAPLCSYAYLTVNGEDWGLYLAVEGVEDAFLQRNYGRDHGELYKPDSTSFGGGRGNGRDFDFDMVDFTAGEAGEKGGGEASAPPSLSGERQEGFDPSFSRDNGMSGMGGSDVKLQYTDDNPESYANIFDNAKTDISEADQARLIRALKTLSEGGDISSAVHTEEVIRYFVVHNFVCNGDSYTGSIVHNYYLYEDGGRLSMIPWDYNLAFGTFQASDAASAVNSPIDTPVSMGLTDDRPMLDWIFAGEAYTALYHQYFAEFLETTDFSALIDAAAALIDPYVEKDPTKFYSYEAFQTGVEALRTFCLLRAESVAGQLDGTIPSTASGQSADSSSLIDASGLTLSDMGTMDNQRMGGGFPGGDRQGNPPGNGDFLPAGGPAGAQPPDTGEQPPDTGVPDRQPDPSAGIPPDRRNGENHGNGFPGNGPDGTASAQTGSSVIPLAVSLLVLLAGLLFAGKFKR